RDQLLTGLHDSHGTTSGRRREINFLSGQNAISDDHESDKRDSPADVSVRQSLWQKKIVHDFGTSICRRICRFVSSSYWAGNARSNSSASLRASAIAGLVVEFGSAE